MSQKLADKILVLGIDGFEPRLAKACMDKGLMPNLKKFVERGACREDLTMLGGLPTVTPPMWTTLATGAYAGTHGITAFYNQHPTEMHRRIYALDSRMCKAEQLWNVFAEAGKKTLVWHWPGSSWPPSSDSTNLSVVDGTQPVAVNMGVAQIDWEKICVAKESNEKLVFKPHTSTGNDGAGCIITGLEDIIQTESNKPGEQDERNSDIKDILSSTNGSGSIVMSEEDSEIVTLGQVKLDEIDSPISQPRGWVDAPSQAKEFAIMTSEGLIRRPCLIVPNAQGIYDEVRIYKSKKDSEPLLTLSAKGEFAVLWDEVYHKDDYKKTYRTMRVMDMAEDGSFVKLWMSMAFDADNVSVWHPQSLYQDILANVGPVAQVSLATGKNPEYAEKLLLEGWDRYCQWQADCLIYLMDKNDVIFSHLHNVDTMGHQMWHFAKHHDEWDNDEAYYQGLLDRVYIQTDNYIGRFLKFLDEGWTIIITSDHGLISEENQPSGLGEGGANATVMRDLGYTVLKKDENGNDLKEIDYAKTRAIASRGCHIYLNIKGRNPQGIVDPADKYELERQIITDLYNYKNPATGQREVALAVRNKDAVVFGMNGEECGDIIFFMDEGYNVIHMDSLATFEGYYNTSVSPIFVAAGKGIKAGIKTERVIRQVDVAPTVAVLGGVRMPRACEGAPIYQILDK